MADDTAERLLAASGIGLLELDRAFSVSRAVGPAAALLGAVDDPVGRPIDALGDALEEVDLPAFVRAAKAVGEPQERETRTSDGAWRHLRASPVADGLVLAIQAIPHSQTAELLAANRDLEQFASAASHDLRGPLTHIAAYVGMVLEDYDAILPAEAKQHLETAIDRASRLQRMVSRLHDYSRLGVASSAMAPAPLDEIAEAIAADLEIEKRSGGVVEIGDLPRVTGDPALLARVFENLFENALHWRGDQPLRISVRAEDLGASWRISVADNGLGVPGEHAERIFEIFRRLEHSGRKGGAGLGLSLCRRIMELHHGRIWLDRDHAGGARFVLELPKPAQSAAASSDVPKTGHG